MREARIGEIIISDYSPVFITLEAGPTHNGIESAKKLSDIAKADKANAIKFQMFDADKLVSDKNQKFSKS